ncbi:MAG: di-trans,poly-cis-decaprenylcistransferase [Deltaproteobacteria bacterium]|nr:di-trans,poly-cis-decaprenylcistransferase [Deltaproteobacteria bacterium]
MTQTHPHINHLACIMDGNGRWASSRGLSRSEGHRAGADAAREIVRHCRNRGLGYLTLYAFSKENWRRPGSEVSFLFDLLRSFVQRELNSLMEQNIRLIVLGDTGPLPLATRTAVGHACRTTAGNSGMVLNMALNYSGRDEIVRACRTIVASKIPPDRIDEDVFSSNLYTAGQPDPDLIIRTSGEIRLSNYLLFQAAYSELFFTDTLWPDFTPRELDEIIATFRQRRRRFGGLDSDSEEEIHAGTN